MHLRKWGGLSLLSVLLLQAPFYGLHAAVHEDRQTALPETKQLSLADVISAALQHHPDTQQLTARTVQAEAWRRHSRSLIANSVSMSFRYQTDRWHSDERLTEYEAGLELPLWWPGTRRATRKLASTLETESDNAALRLRWQVAGLVRESLWRVAAAHDALGIAERGLMIATKLLAVVERRHELGDVPKNDVMLAENYRLEAESLLIRAEADVRDTEVAYAFLTNLKSRPPFVVEQLSEIHDIGSNHPALAYATAHVRRTQAQYARAKKLARGNPSLLVGPRRERPQFGDRFEDSFGLTLTVPVGGGSHADTQVSAVGRELAASRAERDHAQRALQAQLHDVDHELSVVQRSLQVAQRSKALQLEQARIGLRAYEVGEVDLLDLLKLQSAALQAEARVESLETQEKTYIALHNQAVGVIP